MPRRFRPRESIRVLESLGWRVVRQRGNHVRLEMPDGRNPVTVPVSRRELDPKTLSSMLRQAGLSIREFLNAAEETL